MKKIFVVIILACTSLAGMAQTVETTETNKFNVTTNSFWSNWFVSGDLAYSMFYSYEEKGFGNRPGLFDGSRSTLNLSVAAGKWFTPGLGLRTKLTGIWGRHISFDDALCLDNKSHNAMKYWNLQEQMLFNVHNLFCGYDEQRMWECIPYFGFGVLRNCDDNEYAHGYSLGLLNTFKLSPKMAVNVELGFNISDDEYSDAAGTSHKNYGITIPTTDRYFTFEVGVTYNLSKTNGWRRSAE